MATTLLEGFATPEKTAGYAARSGGASNAYARLDDLFVASIGLGTRLGEPTDEVDSRYRAVVLEALRAGINVLDTSSSFREGRSEVTVGRALSEAVASRVVERSEVVVVTKGGYLSAPQKFGPWVQTVQREILDAGFGGWDDVARGPHCLQTGFLEAAVERSRQNLGVQTLDVYLLHNPEEHLRTVSRARAMERFGDAFRLLERLCDEGKIRRYGISTWDQLRVGPDDPCHVSLFEWMRLAREAGGERHRFRVLQVPLTITASEAMSLDNQPHDPEPLTPLQAAHHLGLYVMATHAFGGGAANFEFDEGYYDATQNLVTDHQRLIQFIRSVPGVGTAVCGTTRRARAKEIAAVLSVPKLSPSVLDLLLDSEHAA